MSSRVLFEAEDNECNESTFYRAHQCPSFDTEVCSGSECCSASSSLKPSWPILNISPQLFTKHSFAASSICGNNNNNNKKTLNICSGYCQTMTDNETCSMGTEITSTSDECAEEFNQVGSNNPIVMGNDDEDSLGVVAEDIILQTSYNQQQWALISKHDNFQLKIDAEENYVCFIGADTVDCHLLLRSEDEDNTTIDGRQAILIYANGSFHLKDLNSSYGTYINERRVPSHCFIKLNEHDEIRFGFSSDVYQLKRIHNHHHYQHKIDENPKQKDHSPVIVEIPRHTKQQSVPPMKLLRIKSSRNNTKSAKEKIAVKDESNRKNSVSKFSPSSFSLMSSSSNSSSNSSSSVTSPSSVFMSAMKMMKLRFKKKSKDKTLICSGNEDITFIRYDNHNDIGSRNESSVSEHCSLSAPESPNQPRSRIYHSHTYHQNEYPQPRKLSAYQIGITFEEHEYDEVARENDIDSCSDQQSTSDRIIMKTVECDGDEDDDSGTLCRKICNSSTNNNNNTGLQDRALYIDQEVYDDDNVLYDTMEKNDQMINDELSENSSSSTMLPHLNSEDRLNNNSSLDAVLLTDSLIKKKCEQMNNSCQLDNSHSMVDIVVEEANTHYHHMDEYHQQNNVMKETIEDNDNDNVTFGSRISSRAAIASKGNLNRANNSQRYSDCDHIPSHHPLSISCQEESKNFFEKLSPYNNLYPEPSSSTTLRREKISNCDPTISNNKNKDIVETNDSEDSEYDIDDIGHLRRLLPTTNNNNTNDISSIGSGNVCESLDCSTALSSNNNESLSLFKNGENDSHQRHSIGGLAFVINFEQKDSSIINEVSAYEKRSSLYNSQKNHTACERNIKNSKIMVVEESQQNLMRLNSKRMQQNISNNKTAINNNNIAKKIDFQTSSSSPMNSSLLKKNDTFDKKIKSNINQENKGSIDGKLELTTLNNNNKTSFDTTSDGASSKASSTSSRRVSSSRSAQLSESAVYLINRMFEDNHEYHHQRYCNNNENQYLSFGNGDYHYGSRSHQSGFSSGSDSSYGIRFNQTDHHIPPSNHRNYKCNSSNASTRMEYDDSLSSLHSNSDSVQRLAVDHLQSMTTVVPSSSTQSTFDKQVDSAIDDDGDLIPDDISETGTYVVEIDEQGHKHRKHNVININNNNINSNKNNNNNDNNNNNSNNTNTNNNNNNNNNNNIELHTKTKSNENIRSSDEDLGGVETNSDYEDYDYEIDEESEDKLEAARKQIDELFSNYEKNQTQKQDNNIFTSNENFTNNATFTRSKRSCSNTQSTKKFLTPNKFVDDKCPPISSFIEPLRLSEAITTFTDNKSKKRISSELMSAFKRINSKLEKTALLGKLSLTENHNKRENNLPKSNNINPIQSRSSTSTTAITTKSSLKCRSAPGTPLLSSTENRKKNINTNQISLCRKASIASSNEYSSTEKLDKSLVFNDENHSRARSESITSNISNQSSNLRFNRAFALRRARLGMDTCGVEISEQAACKAKESQVKSVPKKVITNPSFRRNDGGRFSLRVQESKTSKAPIRNFQPTNKNNNNASTTTKITNSKPPTSTPGSKIPTLKSYSTSSSVCSSIESLSTPKKMSESRGSIRKRNDKLPTKISHSDNEILFDGDSSCDEASPLFTRFGRSSMRGCSGNSSTPWLKSLKTNSQNTIEKSKLMETTQDYPLFGSNNRFQNHSESRDFMSDTVSVNAVHPIGRFQVNKRFFSTKTHRIPQFEKELNIIGGRSVSANSQPVNPISLDSNLMTHSVTESLLSQSNVANNIINQKNKSNEDPSASSATSAISSNINARIFSISPLDSLVISAINQLSSKLRTRMRDFLERERSNHIAGSEARSLIDEILPQVSIVSGSDSRFSTSKNAYNHESSNISRDLSNILKNLKKVEQIFDVFYMLLEPNINCQEVSGEHETTGVTNSPIITNASDSDTSGEGSHISIAAKQSCVIKPSSGKVRNNQFQIGQTQTSSTSSVSQSRSGFFIEI